MNMPCKNRECTYALHCTDKTQFCNNYEQAINIPSVEDTLLYLIALNNKGNLVIVENKEVNKNANL